jgi:hypothetical protein
MGDKDQGSKIALRMGTSGLAGTVNSFTEFLLLYRGFGVRLLVVPEARGRKK